MTIPESVNHIVFSVENSPKAYRMFRDELNALRQALSEAELRAIKEDYHEQQGL